MDESRSVLLCFLPRDIQAPPVKSEALALDYRNICLLHISSYVTIVLRDAQNAQIGFDKVPWGKSPNTQVKRPRRAGLNIMIRQVVFLPELPFGYVLAALRDSNQSSHIEVLFFNETQVNVLICRRCSAICEYLPWLSMATGHSHVLGRGTLQEFDRAKREE